MSSTYTLATIAAIIACASPLVSAAATPLTTDQVTFFNSIASGMVPQVNTEIPTQVKALGWDPKESLFEGSYTVPKTIKGLKYCSDATLTISYNLTNLVGLSTIQIESLQITGGDQPSAQSYNFDMTGSTSKATISADVTGKGSLTCSNGAAAPLLNLAGSVTGSGLSGSMSGVAGAELTPEAATLSSMKVTKFTPDYEKVDVKISGFTGVASETLLVAGWTS